MSYSAVQYVVGLAFPFNPLEFRGRPRVERKLSVDPIFFKAFTRVEHSCVYECAVVSSYGHCSSAFAVSKRDYELHNDLSCLCHRYGIPEAHAVLWISVGPWIKCLSNQNPSLSGQEEVKQLGHCWRSREVSYLCQLRLKIRCNKRTTRANSSL